MWTDYNSGLLDYYHNPVKALKEIVISSLIWFLNKEIK